MSRVKADTSPPFHEVLRVVEEHYLDHRARSGAGLVYFVRGADSGCIKIGWARKSVEKRVAMLQTGSLEELRILGCISGFRKKERELHERFASSRIRGEWFSPTPDLLEFIHTEAVAAEDVDDLSKCAVCTAWIAHDCDRSFLHRLRATARVQGWGRPHTFMSFRQWSQQSSKAAA